MDRVPLVGEEEGRAGFFAPSSSSGKEQQQHASSSIAPSHSRAKYAALVVLVVQNASLALTMRYSRASVPAGSGGMMYVASTAVVVAEVLKLATSTAMVCREEGGWAQARRRLYQEVVVRWGEMAKLLVPAVLYVIQNNLGYVAVSNLDAATYQVLYQLKILTTALFSVLLLGRQLDRNKWLALLLLVAGVSLVQLSGQNASTFTSKPTNNNAALGLVCVLLACLSSGFAGVWFEKVLKGGNTTTTTSTTTNPYTPPAASAATAPSIWVRNVQLALIGATISLLGVYGSTTDAAAVAEHGFFSGYRPIVWCVVLLQALGGIVVAVVVKYADNLLKGFATSVSIILSCLLSLLLFDDFKLSPRFLLGTALVIVSTLAYSAQPGHGPFALCITCPPPATGGASAWLAAPLRTLLPYIPAGSPLRGALQGLQKRGERAFHRGSDDGVHILDTEAGAEEGTVL